MSDQYQIMPIPDRMVSLKVAQKWKLTAEQWHQRADTFETAYKHTRRSRLWWKIVAGLSVLINLGLIFL